MRIHKSSRAKRKGFHRKSEFQMICLICGGHVGAPRLYTNMASPSINLREAFW